MTRHTHFLVFTLCIALLVVRVGGAHLHLCFDGKEVPASVHLVDDGLHHDTADGMSAGHNDLDVDLGMDLLAKLPKLDMPELLVLAAVLFLLSTLRRIGIDFAEPTLCIAARPLHLRPPLRGPPRFSFV